mmetsp:Transcript_13764/g.24467  ORF Transcript_13764/g.24467 Transcript_13764/m.24467 type:complete len:1149 (+) Transcript_13764:321-3767(+)
MVRCSICETEVLNEQLLRVHIETFHKKYMQRDEDVVVVEQGVFSPEGPQSPGTNEESFKDTPDVKTVTFVNEDDKSFSYDSLELFVGKVSGNRKGTRRGTDAAMCAISCMFATQMLLNEWNLTLLPETVDDIMRQSDNYYHTHRGEKGFDPLSTESLRKGLGVDLVPLSAHCESIIRSHVYEPIKKDAAGPVEQQLSNIEKILNTFISIKGSRKGKQGVCGIINCGLDTVVVFICNGIKPILFDPTPRTHPQFAHNGESFLMFDSEDDLRQVLELIMYPVFGLTRPIRNHLRVSQANECRFFLFRSRDSPFWQKENLLEQCSPVDVSVARKQMFLDRSVSAKCRLFDRTVFYGSSLVKSFCDSCWVLPAARTQILSAGSSESASSLMSVYRTLFECILLGQQNTTAKSAIQTLTREIFGCASMAMHVKDIGGLFESLMRETLLSHIASSEYGNKPVAQTSLPDVFSFTTCVSNIITDEKRVLENFLFSVPAYKFLSFHSDMPIEAALKNVLHESVQSAETFPSRNSLFIFLPQTRKSQDATNSTNILGRAVLEAEVEWVSNMPECDIAGKRVNPRPAFFMLRSKGQVLLNSTEHRTVHVAAHKNPVEALSRRPILMVDVPLKLSDFECFLDIACMEKYILAWILVVLEAHRGDRYYKLQVARLSPALNRLFESFILIVGAAIRESVQICTNDSRRISACFFPEKETGIEAISHVSRTHTGNFPQNYIGESVKDVILDKIHSQGCKNCSEISKQEHLLRFSEVSKFENPKFVKECIEYVQAERICLNRELKRFASTFTSLLQIQRFAYLEDMIDSVNCNMDKGPVVLEAKAIPERQTKCMLRKSPAIVPLFFDWSRTGKGMYQQESYMASNGLSSMSFPGFGEVQQFLKAIDKPLHFEKIFDDVEATVGVSRNEAIKESTKFWDTVTKLFSAAESPSEFYETLQKISNVLVSNDTRIVHPSLPVAEELEESLEESCTLFQDDEEWGPIIREAAGAFRTQLKRHHRIALSNSAPAYVLFTMVVATQRDDTYNTYVYTRELCSTDGVLSSYWFSTDSTLEHTRLSWGALKQELCLNRSVPVLCFYIPYDHQIPAAHDNSRKPAVATSEIQRLESKFHNFENIESVVEERALPNMVVHKGEAVDTSKDCRVS